MPLMHARKTSLARYHFGLFIVAHAEGQHSCLTSFAKHMDIAGCSNQRAIINANVMAAPE